MISDNKEGHNLRSVERDFEAHLLIRGIKRMFHFKNLKSPKQAEMRAQKLAKRHNGRVLIVKKVNVDDWPSGIEMMRLKPQKQGYYLGAGVYDSDIDLDKILGLRKNNRGGNRRRKKGY